MNLHQQHLDTYEESEPIVAFRGAFAFLSNFYPHPVMMEGETYPTAEHAFQAMKTLDPVERSTVRNAPTPAMARRRGKKVTLRNGWSDLRFTVMEAIVRAKFRDSHLASLLLATGTRPFIEGNTWLDYTWGASKQPMEPGEAKTALVRS